MDSTVRDDFRALYRLTDDGDVWANSHEWGHTVALALYRYDPNDVPADWQFRPADSLTGDDDSTVWEEFSNWEFMVNMFPLVTRRIDWDGPTGEVQAEIDELIYWGNMLVRLIEMQRANGREY